MGPKKKEKGKKNKKDKEKKTTKSEYVAKVVEGNAALALERKKTAAVEDSYFAGEKRYEQVQEDMADVIKYLRHEIEENQAEIDSFDGKISQLNTELKKIDKSYEIIFNEMESEYAEKKTEMDHQIQQLNAKLIASEETKQQREEYLKKKEELEEQIKQMEIRQKNEIYEAEKLAIMKQDKMQKDMEFHLTSLIFELRQASDFAIGETINKLVRDNITLGNTLTCMQETIESSRQSYNKIKVIEKNLKFETDLLNEERNMIIQTHMDRISKINSLIKGQEELYERLRSCEKLIKGKRRLLRQIAEEECILREKNEKLRNLLRVLNENEENLNCVQASYSNIRNNVVSLLIVLFEVTKKVKEGIDVENIIQLEDEQSMELTDKEELEENLIEFKCKARESIIEYVIQTLSKNVSNETDSMLVVHSDSFISGSCEN